MLHRHCEERSDEAIQDHILAKFLDRFAASPLAMTLIARTPSPADNAW